MLRKAQRNGVLPAGDEIAHALRALEDQRQRTGPEGAGERERVLGDGGGPLRQVLGRGQVHDQRMVGGAALGGEDLVHGFRIQRIGGEAVDGLGRQDDECAIEERRGCGAGVVSDHVVAPARE